MKVSTVCHGNIARSQILHHYLADYAGTRSLDLELFSCGTAPVDAYPEVDRLLEEVRSELRRRGLSGLVKRDILDEEALQDLASSDLILAADSDRKQEILARLGDQADTTKVMLFYEFIGEGKRDFTDTYDTEKGAQDPERFSRCFDELERIAEAAIEQIDKRIAQDLEP
jgi:protein-tyrosine-phosphatase